MPFKFRTLHFKDPLGGLVADSFHTKKLCSRFSSSKVLFYMENGCFAFLSWPTLQRGFSATAELLVFSSMS